MLHSPESSYSRQNSDWLKRPAAILCALFALTCSALAQAQTETQFRAADTSSPRATMESFIAAGEHTHRLITGAAHGDREQTSRSEVRQSIAQMLRCLDLSEFPEFVRDTEGREAAVCLKEVFDRIEIPPFAEIPGGPSEGDDPSAAPLEGWRVPETDIYIKRIEEGPHKGDYLFSAATAGSIVESYEFYADRPYKKGATENFYAWYLTIPGPLLAPVVDRLPDGFRTRIIARHAIWQWLALAISIPAGLALMLLAYRAGRRRSKRFEGRRTVRYFLTLLFPIAAMLIPLLIGDFIVEQVRISGKLLTVISFISGLAFLLAGMVVVTGLFRRIAEAIIANPKVHPMGLDAQLIRVVCRVLGLLCATILFLEGGGFLGIPLSTLLASAGVGGLALALAAQDSLKNFFGSMMIILDKPYRIDERIVVKGYDGIVEEIGLRSTRMRLLNGHQVTIPNEEMARSDIENIGRREHIRRADELRLPIGTPADKMEQAVEIVRDILADHQGMDENLPPRAYFTEITPEGFILKFIYWFHPPVMWDYLEFSQGVNLRIQREFAAAGIGLESPTKLLDVTHTPPYSDTLTKTKKDDAEDH